MRDVLAQEQDRSRRAIQAAQDVLRAEEANEFILAQREEALKKREAKKAAGHLRNALKYTI